MTPNPPFQTQPPVSLPRQPDMPVIMASRRLMMGLLDLVRGHILGMRTRIDFIHPLLKESETPPETACWRLKVMLGEEFIVGLRTGPMILSSTKGGIAA
jgi:hypothetical protein